MKDKPTEWIYVPRSHPETTPERLAEIEAMLDADPEVKRRKELFELEKTRPLSPEQDAELEELLRPITEMAARMEFDEGPV